MNLQEFDLLYTHQTTIKGQAIADIIVEVPCENMITNKDESRNELVEL